MRIVLVVTALLAAAAALPTDIPEPGQLALVLGEEEFEDYLDAWLELEQSKSANSSYTTEARSGCTLNVNGDLGQPQPVYIRGNNYLAATGNTGQIRLNTGEQVTIACTGSGRTILHPNIAATRDVATATCVSNNLVSGAGWLNGNGAFGQLTCSAHAFHEAQWTTTRCFNNNLVIRVGFIVNNVFYPLYWSCFDQNRLEVLYVWYDQNTENAVHQSGVDRPSWLAGSFFPGVAVNTMYTQVNQKAVVTQLVGATLADKYVTTHQFMARGHLAAKSDYVFATGQRATFYFINAAPQWQPFNAGNWNWLEQNLRARIGAAGYNTVIYTGTFGISQLRDQNNRLVDLYLVPERNQLPVPLYFYKVVYDASRRIGTAFVSINNPYYTEAEVRALTFCTDRCRNNNAFNWLNWQPDRIDIGYSFCCTVDDFRRTVPHLPAFTTNGLLSYKGWYKNEDMTQRSSSAERALLRMRSVLVLTALLAAAAALPSVSDIPEPGQLALVLGEDDFEDYLDAWLELEQSKNASNVEAGPRSGCTLRINGDLGQPQPVYLRGNRYLAANGNTGQIRLNTGENVVVACTGSGRTIQHPNIIASRNVATATCVNNNLVSGAGWLNGNRAFGQLTCSTHSHHEAQGTNTRCWNNNLVIRVGFIVNNVFYPLYWSCFNQARMEVIYVWYDQTRENAVHQTGVDRPSWLAGSFFPGVAVNTMYTQANQRTVLTRYVGAQLADRYLTSHQFLARGHLAAKSDYVFATGQRATFYFINAAPQWQPFNAGNWNWLEQNLRARIGAAGYNTVIYTGTFGVTQLRDQNNRFVDIYLVPERNQIPVPLYYYKVVYDASRRIGTAFVSINNPYYTLAEARARQFCTDRCRNNNAFNWLRWQPDRIDIGYSFCCTIDDFRRTVPHLPAFTTNGLLS
ncbi:uncharacterized protein LOC110377300 [Helicoverpa armigera]|uniref:uncharacterized protein LOC110377300 n=1 Tax=Helicoverpa armigera TaxID=29058 RepID=UPI003083BC86